MLRYKEVSSSASVSEVGESSDEDEAGQITGSKPKQQQKGLVVTSSGRVVRQAGTTLFKQEGGGGEQGRNDEESKFGQQRTMRRVRMHDIDRMFAPNLSKIGHYLKAVRSTRANSHRQLVEEEKQRAKAGEPTLAQLWTTAREELPEWVRVEDVTPSLNYWLGKRSIEFVVHGAVPREVTGLDEDGDEVEIERRPLPIKMPAKRGRPRKVDVEKQRILAKEEKKKLKAAPSKLIEEQPITVNEHLHTLVDASCARRSRTTRIPTQTASKPPATASSGTRRTNNSMASALEEQPSSSSAKSSSGQTTSRQQQQQPPSSPPFPSLNRVKVEFEHFSLPSDFSVADLQASTSPQPPSTTASIGHHHHEPSSAGSSNANGTALDKSTTSAATTTTSSAFETPPSASSLPNHSAEQQTGRKTTTTFRAKNSRGFVDLPDEGRERVRLALFSARTFPFDVDRSPAVQHFESVQAVDIFHTLPNPSPSELVANNAGHGQQQDDQSPAFNLVDRLVLRQSKRAREHAQVLFCGGPIAAIAACPRRMDDGRQLFAIATFGDEHSLEWRREDGELGEGSGCHLQIWTLNSEEPSEPAKLAFLLLVSGVPQICSLAWCPQLVNQSADKRPREAVTTTTSNGKDVGVAPLGLLAVGTSNGRVHIYSFPQHLDTTFSTSNGISNGTSADEHPASPPLMLKTTPLLVLRHPPVQLPHLKERPSSPPLDSIPLLCLQWSPFLGARHVAAISASGSVHIWDVLGRGVDSLPLWSLHFEDWQGPPTSLGWMEADKICVTSRHRQLRVYRLCSSPNEPRNTACQLLLECDTAKSVGSQCCTRPLLFPGLLSFDSTPFNYFGNPQQALSYIWTQKRRQQGRQDSSTDDDDEEEGMEGRQICATNLSNCHQIRLAAASICPQSGICASVGADGRLFCSLNGRMAPREGLHRETESFMHGRALLQLIGRTRKEEEEKQQRKPRPKFCFSHEDCCAQKWLEVRLGDCALLDQRNERANGRPAPEVSLDRRLESLSSVDFSHTSVGLSFCGGESGLVFITPCTL